MSYKVVNDLLLGFFTPRRKQASTIDFWLCDVDSVLLNTVLCWNKSNSFKCYSIEDQISRLEDKSNVYLEYYNNMQSVLYSRTLTWMRYFNEITNLFHFALTFCDLLNMKWETQKVKERVIKHKKYPKVNMWEETGPSCTSFKCCRFIFLIDSQDSELLSKIDWSASLSVSIILCHLFWQCALHCIQIRNGSGWCSCFAF